MDSYKIYINDKECKASPGETVLAVAWRDGIFIPALCYHCDLKPHESCRLCMVEIEGEKGLRAACSFSTKPEMRIKTETDELKHLLRLNLELLFAQHRGKCEVCIKREDCILRDLVKRYLIEDKYSNRKAGKAKYQFGPAIVFEPEKCINCENCSEICAKQTNGGYLRPREGKYNFEVSPSRDLEHDCIYCGQCIAHCPVGALSEKDDSEKVYELLRAKEKKIIFQFAPAIRVSLGEEFGMPEGEVVTDKIFAALKKIGGYKAFDTSFAADVTVMEEAGELVEKIIQNHTRVMFSSCCPAWVKYVEFYEKEFIGDLTSVRSPQIIEGGIIKKYWAQKEGINLKDLLVVSIMPCTAKKFEITRKEMFVDGVPPVDYVLTTREFAKLLKKYDVDLKYIEPDTSAKEMLASATGASEIFGAAGGVLEAALRTAYNKITGKEFPDPEIKQMHEQTGIKKLEIEIKGTKIKAVAVNGIENVKSILSELKENPLAYNYVEVMACPGGCIGGGGQPLPVDNEKRKKRAEALYGSDRSRSIRTSHQSPAVKEIYKEFLDIESNRKPVCLTSYKIRKKGKLKITK